MYTAIRRTLFTILILFVSAFAYGQKNVLSMLNGRFSFSFPDSEKTKQKKKYEVVLYGVLKAHCYHNETIIVLKSLQSFCFAFYLASQ
jgi:hypothetical protein